jgi:hypothetical protein
LSTIPAEWQARQLLLIASASVPPGMRLIGTVLEPRLPRLDVGARRVGNAIGRRHPETVLRCVQNLDIVQHLDPIGRIPSRNDQAHRKAVQQRQLRAVHHRLVQAIEADRDGAGLHRRTIQHIAQPHAGLFRIAHGTVLPLPVGNPRLEQAA